MEEKPSLRLTTGLVAEAWVRAHLAHTGPEEFAGTLQSRLSEAVRKLPWDVVQDNIKEAKAGFEVRSAALMGGIAQQEMDSAALKMGEVSATVARRLVAKRNQFVNCLPYKSQVVAALSPEAAKARILSGCDRNGRVNLVNPAKSVDILRQKVAAGG